MRRVVHHIALCLGSDVRVRVRDMVGVGALSFDQ